MPDLLAEIDGLPDKRKSVLDEIDTLPSKPPKANVLDEIDALPAKPTRFERVQKPTPLMPVPKGMSDKLAASLDEGIRNVDNIIDKDKASNGSLFGVSLKPPPEAPKTGPEYDPLLEEQLAHKKLTEAYSQMPAFSGESPDVVQRLATHKVAELRKRGQPLADSVNNEIGILSGVGLERGMEARKLTRDVTAPGKIARAIGIPATTLMQDVGDIASRPGGALRSVLSGEVRGLKGLIPFGETMGLYDPKKDAVSGQHMLNKWGVIEGENNPLFSKAGLAGFAAELVDPLWFTKANALTKLGRAAKINEGTMATMAALKKEFDAAIAASDLARAELAAKQINDITKGLSSAETVTGKAASVIKQAGAAEKLAPTKAAQAEAGQRALLQLRLPFTDKELNWGGRSVYKSLENVASKMPFAPVPEAAVRTKAIDSVLNSADDALRVENAKAAGAYGKEGGIAAAIPGERETTADAIKSAMGKGVSGREFVDMVEGRIPVKPEVADEVGKFIKRGQSIGAEEKRLIGLQPIEGAYYPRMVAEEAKPLLDKMKANPDKFNTMVAEANAILKERGLPPVEFGKTKAAAKTMAGVDSELKSLVEKNGVAGEFLDTVMHGSTKERKFKGLSTTEWNDLLEKHIGGRLFSEDPAQAMLTREMRHNRVQSAAKFMRELEGAGGKQVDQVVSKPVNGVPAGVEATDSGGYVNRMLNEDRAAAGLKPMVFESADEADLVGRMYNKAADPKTIPDIIYKAINDAYDKTKQIQSGYLTKGGTKFSVRNRLENMIRSWLYDVPPVGEHRTAANKLVAGDNVSIKLGDGRTLNEKQLMEAAVKNRIVGEGFYKDAAQVTEKGSALQKLNPLNTNEFLPLQAIDKASATVAAGPGQLMSGNLKGALKLNSQKVEEVDRLAHWISKMKAGLNEQQAAEDVMKALGDYSGRGEGALAKELNRHMMFSRYVTNVIPAMAGATMQNPGKVAALARLGTQPGKPEHAPTYLREGQMGGTGLKDSKGQDIVVSDFANPLQGSLEWFAGVKAGPKRFAEKVLSGAHPVLNALAEGGSGRSFFYDKNIEDMKRPMEGVEKLPFAKEALGLHEVINKKGESHTEGDPWKMWAASKFGPTSVAMNLIHRLTDSKKDPEVRAFNLFSGLRINSMDEKEQALRDVVSGVDAELAALEKSGQVSKTQYGWKRNKTADEGTREIMRMRERADKELKKLYADRKRQDQLKNELPFSPPSEPLVE